MYDVIDTTPLSAKFSAGILHYRQDEPHPNRHFPKDQTSKLVNDTIRRSHPTTVMTIIYLQHVEGCRLNEKRQILFLSWVKKLQVKRV